MFGNKGNNLGFFLLFLAVAFMFSNVSAMDYGITGDTCLIDDDIERGLYEDLGGGDIDGTIVDADDKNVKPLENEAATLKPFPRKQPSVSGMVFGYILPGREPYWEGEPKSWVLKPMRQISTSVLGFSFGFTNKAGRFSLPFKNSTGTLITVPKNHYIDVYDMRNGSIKTGIGKFQINVTEDYDLGKKRNYDLIYPGESFEDVANTNIYYYVLDTMEWAQKYGWEPEFVAGEANTDFGCNAFYNPDSNKLIFGKESHSNSSGLDCANSAYSSIIRHEYGHKILDTLIPWCRGSGCGFINYKEYHEGGADTIFSLSTRDSCFGQDFYGWGECLRDIDEDWVFPVLNGSSHDKGRPLSGSFWDLAVELSEIYGDEDKGFEITERLFFHMIFNNKVAYDPSVRDYVIEADERYYGGEHKEIIDSVFEKHGL